MLFRSLIYPSVVPESSPRKNLERQGHLESREPGERDQCSSLPLHIGQDVDIRIEDVVHGGHMIGRVDGFAVFVRHALPGEFVRARVTDVRRTFARADAIEIWDRHEDRVESVCSAFGAFGCGGCDFLHANRPLQLRMKEVVLREALGHHGGLPSDVVDELMGEGIIDLGLELEWRTRMTYSVYVADDGTKRLGLHRHRSSQIIDASCCRTSSPPLHSAATAAIGGTPSGGAVVAALGDDSAQVLICDDKKQSGASSQQARVTQRLRVDEAEFVFRPGVGDFWQVHPALLAAIIEAVVEFGRPTQGSTWWDLYSGSGPISAALAVSVGSRGSVHAVETASAAISNGRRALHNVPSVRLQHATVMEWLERSPSEQPEGVVLDPPRAGAGRRIVESITSALPRVVIYVACDPVALARDCAIFHACGYEMDRLRVFDAFPQTHHMETIAAFVPSRGLS